MRFELDYPPSLNRYWRIWRGRAVLSSEGRSYKQRAGYRALEQRVRVQDGRLAVSLWFFRPRAVRDLDNEMKAIFDALNGVAWWDDSQVDEIHAYKRDDRARPRVEIEVSVLND